MNHDDPTKKRAKSLEGEVIIIGNELLFLKKEFLCFTCAGKQSFSIESAISTSTHKEIKDMLDEFGSDGLVTMKAMDVGWVVQNSFKINIPHAALLSVFLSSGSSSPRNSTIALISLSVFTALSLLLLSSDPIFHIFFTTDHK